MLLLFLLLIKTADVAVVVSAAIIITRAVIIMIEMYIAGKSDRLMTFIPVTISLHTKTCLFALDRTL